MHARILEWFVLGTAPKNLEALNSRIYADIFLTPNYDAWLGPRPRRRLLRPRQRRPYPNQNSVIKMETFLCQLRTDFRESPSLSSIPKGLYVTQPRVGCASRLPWVNRPKNSQP